MNEKPQLIELIQNKAKMVAMLAPSFPIVYDYPQIIGKLRALGFEYITEVTIGAKKTNEQVAELLKANPQGRYITSPCPSFVRLVRKRYPHLVPFLAFQADSPMIANARIVKEKYPGYRPVFIGPCLQKKLESSEDYPYLEILVVTYKELDEIFQQFNIVDKPEYANDAFDMAEKTTRIYPTDGGLTDTSGARSLLKDEEIRVVSGWKNFESALAEFESNKTIRLLDVLFCEGGCIHGPGIVSTLSVEERKNKVLDYAKREDIVQKTL